MNPAERDRIVSLLLKSQAKREGRSVQEVLDARGSRPLGTLAPGARSINTWQPLTRNETTQKVPHVPTKSEIRAAWEKKGRCWHEPMNRTVSASQCQTVFTDCRKCGLRLQVEYFSDWDDNSPPYPTKEYAAFTKVRQRYHNAPDY
eukprot:TRINITY_DN84885_c0_g1_i1.p1 TRINITY_DN84885_c0_g1~~TRINITY_DN84885_c0_g1_i1.p1  ORF type:complete len:146 (-),score=7.29 TRINITY_DN84885_c0_g1_i1:106-543(-)